MNIFKLNKKQSVDEIEFYKRKKILEEKYSLSAKFKSSPNDVKVDFQIGKEWTLLKSYSNGHIEFRCFTEEAFEEIQGVKRKTKSAQNFWKKGSFIKTHYHSDSDEYIYLVNGVLEIVLEDSYGNITEKVYNSGTDQPIIILAGVKHYVKCLTQASFVSKFVFK